MWNFEPIWAPVLMEGWGVISECWHNDMTNCSSVAREKKIFDIFHTCFYVKTLNPSLGPSIGMGVIVLSILDLHYLKMLA